MGEQHVQYSSTSHVRVLVRVRPALPDEYQFDEAVEVPSVSPCNMQQATVCLNPSIVLQLLLWKRWLCRLALLNALQYQAQGFPTGHCRYHCVDGTQHVSL